MKPVATVPIPECLAGLDRDRRGYPIPFIVYRDTTGKPHFQINDETKRQQAIISGRCALTGERFTAGRWFIGGALAAFHPQGAYIDPPACEEAARYAMAVCPYLAARSYNGRLDGRTLNPAHVACDFGLDTSMVDDRPELFVLAEAYAVGLVTGDDPRRPIDYLVPKRPYRTVEFWRHGEKLPFVEGAERAVRASGGQLTKGMIARACGMVELA